MGPISRGRKYSKNEITRPKTAKNGAINAPKIKPTINPNLLSKNQRLMIFCGIVYCMNLNTPIY